MSVLSSLKRRMTVFICPQLFIFYLFFYFFLLWEYICVTGYGMSHRILDGEQVTDSFMVSLLKASLFLFHSSFLLSITFYYSGLQGEYGRLPVWGLSVRDVNLMLTGHQQDLFVRRLSCCLRLSHSYNDPCGLQVWQQPLIDSALHIKIAGLPSLVLGTATTLCQCQKNMTLVARITSRCISSC